MFSAWNCWHKRFCCKTQVLIKQVHRRMWQRFDMTMAILRKLVERHWFSKPILLLTSDTVVSNGLIMHLFLPKQKVKGKSLLLQRVS